MTYLTYLRDTPDDDGVTERSAAVPSHFGSFTETRTHLRHVLDSAATGRVTTIQRDDARFAVVDARLLVRNLMRLRPAGAVVTAEGGGWSAVLPGLPVHGDGDTFKSAVEDLLDALRDYADDWNDRLLSAPNHRENWPVVELAKLASDDELRAWLLGDEPVRP